MKPTKITAYIITSDKRARLLPGLTILLAALLLAGCNPIFPSSNPVPTVSSAPQLTPYAGPVNRPTPSTGCGHPSPVPPGRTSNITIPISPAVSEGRSTRTYLVHLPGSYQPTQALPVVLIFHGYGGSAASMEGTGFSQLADQQHFIAVYPQGLPDGPGGPTFWAEVGPIDYGVDDAFFVSTVLDDLQHKLCVDPRRIYATGFSDGGGMTGFLACKLAGRIAAFAPVSGNFYSFAGGCHPGRPVPILDFHGTADHTLPYNGIPSSKYLPWPLPAIPDWLQGWAARDGCATQPAIFLRTPNATGEQWPNCQPNSTVIHYRMEGGGHNWPTPINGLSATNIILHFFQNHPLPTTS